MTKALWLALALALVLAPQAAQAVTPRGAAAVPTGTVFVRIQLEIPTPDVFAKLAKLGFVRGQDQVVGAKTYYTGTLPAANVARVKAMDDVVSIDFSK